MSAAAGAVARLIRGARRVGGGLRRTRPLTVVAIVSAAAVVVTLGWQLPGPSVDTSGGGSVVRVGVTDGDVIADYAAASTAQLTELSAQDPERTVYALVSLASYLTPVQIGALFAGSDGPGSGSQSSPSPRPIISAHASTGSPSAGVSAWPTSAHASARPPSAVVTGQDARLSVAVVAGYARVPVPRRQTELVRLGAQRIPADLLVGMAQVGDRKEHDATRYATMARTEASPPRRALYQSNAELAVAEARAYRAGCACVFAVVVRGPVASLMRLVGQSGIRVVDPAPEIRNLLGAVFTPPLPEQRDRVAPLPDDGIATQSRSPN